MRLPIRLPARLGDEALRAALAHIEFPVLLVAGRDDPLFAQALIAEGARLLSGARLEVIDRCGHFPMWEQPETFHALLESFLDETTAPPRPAGAEAPGNGRRKGLKGRPGEESTPTSELYNDQATQ